MFSIWCKSKKNSAPTGTLLGGVESTPKPVCWPCIFGAAVASIQVSTAASVFMGC